MAKRKPYNKPILPAPNLSIPRPEAEEKIQARITTGKALFDTPINNQTEFDDIKAKRTKWDDYNQELLGRIFDSEAVLEDYNAKPSFASVRINPSLTEQISSFKEGIYKKITALESIAERLELIPVLPNKINHSNSVYPQATEVDKSKVFIVHGHDDLAKIEMARLISDLGFEPIILHEQASSGKTIIEKIESYTNVGFAVVLYTPCDKGGKDDDPINLKPRARQNVVFEHGYLIGKLGRDKVCALVRGNVETPNDISGVVYVTIDTHGAWKYALAEEMSNAGFDIDKNKIKT